MMRNVVTAAVIAACAGVAVPASADPDVHGFLRAATPEQREDIRDELEDVREAKTPEDKREEKAELRDEIRNAKKEPVLREGRASTAGAPSGGGLQGLVQHYAAQNGVPGNVAHGVVMVESRYRANATGPGGYIGLMQIGYATAKGMGYSGSRAGLYDPETNLRYGMKYLGQAYAMTGGNLCGTVSKYQGGHGVKGVTRAGSVYCGKVKKYMAQRAPAERQVVERDGQKS